MGHFIGLLDMELKLTISVVGVKLRTYLSPLLKVVFSIISGLKPAVKTRPAVSLKAHNESESNFQSM